MESVQKKRVNPVKPLKRLFSYQWIVDHALFFLFLSVLAIVYIANGHQADKVIRDINRTTQELKSLQFEYKTLKSEVMYKSQEAQIQKSVAPLQLQPSDVSPRRLVREK
jgi:cell division protein FtsL